MELNKCFAQVEIRIKWVEPNDPSDMCGCFEIIYVRICYLGNVITFGYYHNILEAPIQAGFYDMFSMIKLFTLLMLPLKIHQRFFR